MERKKCKEKSKNYPYVYPLTMTANILMCIIPVVFLGL